MPPSRSAASREGLTRADDEATAAEGVGLMRLLFLENEYLPTLTEAELRWSRQYWTTCGRGVSPGTGSGSPRSASG